MSICNEEDDEDERIRDICLPFLFDIVVLFDLYVFNAQNLRANVYDEKQIDKEVVVLVTNIPDDCTYD